MATWTLLNSVAALKLGSDPTPCRGLAQDCVERHIWVLIAVCVPSIALATSYLRGLGMARFAIAMPVHFSLYWYFWYPC